MIEFKVGVWRKSKDKDVDLWKCSLCGHGEYVKNDTELTECPSCKAQMISYEE